MSAQSLEIEPVRSGDEPAALALVFADLEPGEREARAQKACVQGASGPVCGLWAAYRGRRMVGAMRIVVQPGKTAFVDPPRIAPDEPAETAAALLAGAVASLPSQGVRLAQSLLEMDHGADAEALKAGGFRHASDLLYLVSLAGAFPESPPAVNLEFVPYASAAERMAYVVEQTYAGSLDCRAIDDVRRVEEVLAGYQGTGKFDPDLWLLARHEGSDVGCLLLAPDASGAAWELVYLGVVPEARLRGFGTGMVRHAQWLAKQAGCRRMRLAVDAANEPAIRVYSAAGFTAWERMCVFLRVF
jgi:ribosomal protein S18 acetylase RimI-like enzyme